MKSSSILVSFAHFALFSVALLLRPIPRDFTSSITLADFSGVLIYAVIFSFGVVGLGRCLTTHFGGFGVWAGVRHRVLLWGIVGFSTVVVLSWLGLWTRQRLFFDFLFVLVCSFSIHAWHRNTTHSPRFWLLAIFGALMAMWAFLCLVPYFGQSDPFRYHIPAPVIWLQNFSTAPSPGFPILLLAGWSEVFILSPTAFLSDHEGKGLLELISFVQLSSLFLFVAGFVYSMFLVVRSRFPSVWAAPSVILAILLFLAFDEPTYIYTISAKNDFMGFALGVSCVALMLRSRSKGSFVLASLALGFSIALKLSNVAFVPLFLIVMWRPLARSKSPIKLLACAAIVSFAPIAMLWARNWYYSESFLFPLAAHGTLISESWAYLLRMHSDQFFSKPLDVMGSRVWTLLTNGSLLGASVFSVLPNRARPLFWGILCALAFGIVFPNSDANDRGVIQRYFLWAEPLAVAMGLAALAERVASFRLAFARKSLRFVPPIVSLVAFSLLCCVGYVRRAGFHFNYHVITNVQVGLFMLTPGAGSKLEARKRTRGHDMLLTTGDDWILTLMPRDVFVLTMQKDLDRGLFRSHRDPEFPFRLVAQSGFRYVVDSKRVRIDKIGDWTTMSLYIDRILPICGGVVVHQDGNSRLLDLAVLADCIAPYCALNSNGLPWIWGHTP